MTEQSIASVPGQEDQAQHPDANAPRQPTTDNPPTGEMDTKFNVLPGDMPGVDTDNDMPADDRVVPKDGQPNYIPGQPEPKGFV